MNSVTLFEIQDNNEVPMFKVVEIGNDYTGMLNLHEILTDSEVDDLIEMGEPIFIEG